MQRYSSQIPLGRIWHKVILMREVMHDSRFLCGRQKKSLSRRHSPFGAPQGATNRSSRRKHALPGRGGPLRPSNQLSTTPPKVRWWGKDIFDTCIASCMLVTIFVFINSFVCINVLSLQKKNAGRQSENLQMHIICLQMHIFTWSLVAGYKIKLNGRNWLKNTKKLVLGDKSLLSQLYLQKSRRR